MAMSTGGGGSSEKPMSDINTTPLVDVMLVLLIIFLIAVPVAIQTVKGIVLPKVRFDPTTTKPENVLLSVTSGPDGNCLVYWGTSPITSKDLLTRAVDKSLDKTLERALERAVDKAVERALGRVLEHTGPSNGSVGTDT